MRGTPLVEWGLFILCWSMLLFPLTRLTARQAIPAPAAAHAESLATTAWVELQFSSLPGTFQLHEGNACIWSGTADTHRVSSLVTVRVDNARAEVRLFVDWEAQGGMKAVECVLEPDGLARQSHTGWTEARRLEEIMVFSW